MFSHYSISGAILAGGRGQRMGEVDKGLIPFLGRPLINHVIDILKPQVGCILISANRHQEDYAQLGFPVVSDRDGGFSGPLAGIARVLEEVTTPFVLVVPCDMPFLPGDLARSLMDALTAHGGEVAVAHGAGRLQPLCILIRRDVDQDLIRYRESGGVKVQEWVLGLQHRVVDFPSRSQVFCNINTPESLYTSVPVAIPGD
jgi:molybdopterin-guanine dinucleotide biosynthesis protein A